MTGLLGAACLTSLRIADPTYPLPVILGMLAWGGLFMRDLRVRALIPFRKAEEKSLRTGTEAAKTASAA
jgi:hypothetical protein